VCGFAGLLDPAAASGVERLGALAGTMAARLDHRGPDDRGLWVDPEGRVALGHRRLSVVDLSPHGHQPMASVDGRWVLAYNGEIYNFPVLRRRLAAEGLAFRGDSDTEVLLGAVQQWGLDAALEASEGMFAFALWDRHRRELHLTRDRFGEKPLYYGWSGGLLVFASELKALCALPGFAAELDRESVALFLRHNCIPAPHTVYRGVAKLRPGHLVTVDAAASPGELPPCRAYWSASEAVEEARHRPLDGPPGDLADRVESALADAVAARMVADVPVGAFLSGGIDSSLVVALMQQAASRPVRTFTVGFAERGYDESAEAAAVAAHLGTDHTALRVSEGDAAEVIPRLSEIWDEPFADISQIPVFLVSRLARTQVTVALSGDGGDELFAGYNRHAWLERLWRQGSALPDPVRRAAGATLARLPPGLVEGAARATGLLPVRWQVRNPSTKVAKVAKVLSASGPDDAYVSLTSHWDRADEMVVGGDGCGGATGWGPGPSADVPPPSLEGITARMLWSDTTGYLPDDILTKVDRAAMANSLETRVPFLDRGVFDVAWRLPMEVKLHDGATKWILRQVLYRHVPAPLFERPKMGFGLPIGAWLRGPLRPWAEELLGERRLRAQGLLDPTPVRLAWRDHIRGRRDLGYELWDVLVLEAWLDRWMPGLAG
jgi:asparagine synthase (glutamine-hydrolysing)